MKKIKNEKGITLVTLTITIVVLMILSFSINVSVKSTMETRNYNYVKEDIINLTDNGSDLGPMEGRIDDLNGLTVEVITNVSFDDYNEEIRLNPKRILSKYYKNKTN